MFIYIYIYIRSVLQFLKENNWAQIKDHKWYVMKITFTESKKRALEYMLFMSAVQLKALLNAPGKVVDNECAISLGDWRFRWWRTHHPTIFTSTTSFKVLNQLENLSKCVEIELPSVSRLNNTEKFRFIVYLYTKDLLLHHPRLDFVIFG